MNKWWWIIFLVGYGVYQVITWTLQNAENQRRQKEQQEMQRRRESAPPQRNIRQSQAPSSMEGIQSAQTRENLAERRKAQLEQLRQRRASRRTGQTVQTRIGRGAPPVGTGVTPPVKPERIVLSGSTIEETRKEQEAGRHAQEQARLLKQRQVRETQQRETEAQAARVREAQRQARVKQQHVEKQAIQRARMTEIRPYERDHDKRLRGARLRSLLGQRSTLRDLFVMKELIDPPVGLREGVS